MSASDRDAEFTGFVIDNAPSLRHTAYLLTGERGAAEDLLQDTLTKTWLAWPGCAAPSLGPTCAGSW